LPDILKEDNSNVFKAEKLTNFRKPYKHMTQLPQQLDRPDVLFGLNEYKEVHPQNLFHNIKKLNNSSSIHDIPDTLDPIKDNQFNQMPRPESMNNIQSSMKEENKNAEIANLKLKEKVLSEIPENNNETERVKSEDNNNINNDNKEEEQQNQNKDDKDKISEKKDERIKENEDEKDKINENKEEEKDKIIEKKGR